MTYEVLHRLKHWQMVYDYKKKELGFEKGSILHMKYLKMKCDQQFRVLVKGKILEEDDSVGK